MKKQYIPEPDDIRDDDHLDRKDISQDEFAKSIRDMVKKYKDRNVKFDKKNDLPDATIDALNKLPKEKPI